MKPWIKPLLIGAIALGLAACSKQGPDSSAASGAAASGEPVIGLAVSTQNNPFFVTLRQAAEAEAKAQGIKLIAVDAQDDAAKQIASIEDLIQKKVSVILINPTDSDALANAVRSANNAKIPVISIDRTINGGDVVAHIASDNVEGGRMAANFLLDQIKHQGKIIELEGIPGSSAARERGQGFNEIVNTVKDVQVVAKQPADFDRAKGLTVTENILQGNKGVKALFAQNDEMALGAAQAVKAAGLKDVVIVGFDATNDAIAAVKAGTLAATVQQKPDLMGKMAVDTAKQLIDGKQVPKSIPVPLNLVTKENAQ
ncbi:D-ribose ABC transporter substrate-binding protein [Jeongeupia sp. HS-3]|uniref:ribose ABC transporter substrate-binding protein RbsB n=1 Tax=Jeongeupia sp. HS-3 TaxID=1009682 RepID=UPI0018A39DD7|nr:ribose ABC transporter substrate-binding protein RbsB [Jeongeupia sp. HS-3]BCL76057.1 D-ribose ABC transporter substrate-binding protein [Jeongeupia sp. HS-3]